MSDLAQEISKRGRPKLKKGKSSWKPASLNEFTDKEDGFRYRMSRKDPENLSKKAQEGWETVSQLASPDTKHDDPERIEDGKSLTSVLEGRDWVLQRLPEDVAKARDEFWNKESARRVEGLTAHVKKEIGKTGGQAHGDITISSRMGTQVIE